MLVRPGKLNQRAVVEPSDPEGGENPRQLAWDGRARATARAHHEPGHPLAARGL